MALEPFGTLFDYETRRPLRAATQDELEAARQSMIRGERGIINVDGAACYVEVSADVGTLDLTRLTPEMLTAMLDMIPIGVALALDSTATRIVGNRRLERMLGMPPGRNLSLTAADSEIPTEFRVLVGGAEVDGADLPFQRAMRTGVGVSGLTVEVARADGVHLHVTMTALPLRDEHGRVVGGIGVFHEVDDPAGAGIAMRISQDFSGESGGWYRAIADALPEHVWACTGNGLAWFCNERVSEYTGRSSAELLGLGWLESVHPDDRDYVNLAWKIATASLGMYDAELRLRRRDGLYRRFRARATPVKRPDGRTVDWFGTASDIDDFKRETQHAGILRSIVHELSTDQDVAQILERAARHCLAGFAGFCIFDVFDRDFGLVRVAFAHVDAAVETRLHDAVFEAIRPDRPLGDAVARVLRERKTQVVHAEQSPVGTGAPTRRLLTKSLAALDAISRIVTPVFESNGALIGILTFGETASDGSRLDEINALFADEIAALMSGTFVRARNVERALRQRRTVDQIVRHSLPAELPSTERIELDAAHFSGRTQRDAGAAWYDAVWLADGRLMLSNGNIGGTGSGIEAALAMAIMRQTLRAAAFMNAEPQVAAQTADRVLRSLYPQCRAAVFFGLFTPLDRELRYILCGHPRPLLRLADSFATPLPGAPSTPLAAAVANAEVWKDERAQMPPGALLAVYAADTAIARIGEAVADGETETLVARALAHLDTLERPAATLLGALSSAPRNVNDLAVMTVLFR
jgi:PAS domain S-box-containing protein